MLPNKSFIFTLLLVLMTGCSRSANTQGDADEPTDAVNLATQTTSSISVVPTFQESTVLTVDTLHNQHSDNEPPTSLPTYTTAGSSAPRLDDVVDDLPIAKSDAFNVKQNAETILPILTNDVGLGDGIAAIKVVGSPEHGAASFDNSGNLAYQPAANYFGSDHFTYQLVDNNGDVATGDVALSVSCNAACSKTFVLSWTASVSPNVSGYKIYVGRSPKQYGETIDLVGSATTFSYTARQLGDYYFAVSAYNVHGIESDFSTEVTAAFPY